MVVKTADGKVVKYNVKKVTEVSFEEAEPVEWVDLGLPSGTLWATMNVGADAPEGQGDKFRWGETEPYDGSGAQTYKFYGSCVYSENNAVYFVKLTKYCSNPGDGYEGFTDSLTELEPEDDAATTNWGSKWQMPSKEQVEELGNKAYTTISNTTQNGVKVKLITSKRNGNSIFMLSEDYWTRSIFEKNDTKATNFAIPSENMMYIIDYTWERHKDFLVRPVRKQ